MVNRTVATAAALAAIVAVSTSCTAGRRARAPQVPSAAQARLARYVNSAPGAVASGLNMTTVGLTQGLCNTCERVYSTAQSGDWTGCGTACSQLNSQWGSVKDAMLAPVTQNSRRDAVAKTLSQLNAAVASKNAPLTKKCANKLYKDLSDITSLCNPSKTSDIRTIKYYCREINQNLDSSNISAAKQNCAKLVQSWNSVRRTADSRQCQQLVNSVNNSLGAGSQPAARVYCAGLLDKCSALENEMAGKRL